MMCREMLVLEEKELVCVEVKGKMEGEKKSRGAEKDGERMCVTEKCVDLQTCVRMRICAHARVRLSKIEKGGRKRQSKTSSRRER